MKTVTSKAVIINENCTGCTICAKVCPTSAISMVDRLAVVAADACFGCNACEQRCPFDAIVMESLTEPWEAGTPVTAELRPRVDELCARARMHPEQILCFCTNTRAEEVAAAVLSGAHSPDALALRTGLRSGCKVACITGLMRVLQAAGIEPAAAPKGHWNWYSDTITIFNMPESVTARYERLGYDFAGDRRLMENVVKGHQGGGSQGGSGGGGQGT